MAKLFPEIEVFPGYIDRLLWTLDSIKHTPLKFAKEMKVLNLRCSMFVDDEFENIFDAIIHKLEADGVVRIGLVSIPWLERIVGPGMKETDAGFPEANCVAKILSRITVDHLILWTASLKEMYAICAQINSMHVQSPINVYFPNSLNWPLNLSVISYQGQLRLGFYDERRKLQTDLCLKLKRKCSGGSEGVHMTGDEADTCKMMTVHLDVRELYGPSDRDPRMKTFEKTLTKTQGLSLEDFPHIEVYPYCNFSNSINPLFAKSVKDICTELGITTNDEWPIEQTHEDKRNTESVCFDSRIDSKPYWLSDREVTDHDKSSDLHAVPVSPSMTKTSPHAGPHPSVTVAVLDTGILLSHEAFLDKIVAMKNFVPNEAGDLYYDANGHGTHCAGIVLQTAPFVRLVICKVISSQGDGEIEWVADAIDWLLNDESGPKNYCPVDIISMSLGGDSFDYNLRRAISAAIVGGKVVVAAASNNGRKNLTNIAFPARFGDVICVGSCNDLGQPSSFTPTGREVDFLAHGDGIQSPSSARFDQYQKMSGTSQATPRVARIAARVISYAEAIGGQEMRSAVCHTAVMREVLRKMASMPGHHDEHMGYGNLDPWRLFKYGQFHFRQVVEEIVGPLHVAQPASQDAATQTDGGTNTPTPHADPL
ncbi:uncharacterized protein LOC144906183 isoform X1 [Branchiostoma floridae x Branchiostoma belcheri]